MNGVAVEVEVDVVGPVPRRLADELDREEVVAGFSLALIARGRCDRDGGGESGQPPSRAGS